MSFFKDMLIHKNIVIVIHLPMFSLYTYMQSEQFR